LAQRLSALARPIPAPSMEWGGANFGGAHFAGGGAHFAGGGHMGGGGIHIH
jgi:hypothetical protein